MLSDKEKQLFVGPARTRSVLRAAARIAFVQEFATFRVAPLIIKSPTQFGPLASVNAFRFLIIYALANVSTITSASPATTTTTITTGFIAVV
jgi:hypothetical protein